MSGTCSRLAPMYSTGNSPQVAVFVSTTVSSTGFMASVTVAPVGSMVGLVTPRGYSWSRRPSRSGRLRTELILPVGVVLQVVLVFGPGFPEGAGLADPGHDLAVPQAWRAGVGDRVLGDLSLAVARIEDPGTVVRTDQSLAEVGPVDLEEELEDGPVGIPRGIAGDLGRLGVT